VSRAADLRAEETRVRAMRWWDIPVVHRIEEQCFPHDCWSTDQFWRELAGSTREYFVAVDGAESVLGYGGISVLAPDSDLQTLAVRPDTQGVGLGRGLLDACLHAAGRRGATTMLLEVRSDNEPAKGMYEKFGFEVIASRPHYYPDGGDALIMRRRPIEAAS